MNLPIVPALLVVAGLAALAPLGKTLLVADSGASASSAASSSSSTPSPLDLVYHRPTEKTKLRNYGFDTFGPYPVAGAAILGAINQADKTPPEWGARRQSLRRANWVRLRHRHDNHDDAVRVGESLS
jgi:hypothetical protein